MRLKNNAFSTASKSQGDQPPITHLFFADDALILSNVSSIACQKLKHILDEFCLASGEMVNRQKSFIIFSPNTPMRFKKFLQGGFQYHSQPDLSHYLGMLVTFSKSKCRDFSFLVGNVIAQLSSWNTKSLTGCKTCPDQFHPSGSGPGRALGFLDS